MPHPFLRLFHPLPDMLVVGKSADVRVMRGIVPPHDPVSVLEDMKGVPTASWENMVPVFHQPTVHQFDPDLESKASLGLF